MKPHILIDARLYGTTHTGIGRYTKNLLLALKNLPEFSHYRFTLLVYQDLLPQVKEDLGNSFSYLATDIPHYSLAEQLKLPCLLNQTKADLVHFTHFNKPLFYFGPSVITIHDLIKHFYKGRGTTTKKSYFYWPKYLAYRLLTTININSTKHIIVPSLFLEKISFFSHSCPHHRHPRSRRPQLRQSFFTSFRHRRIGLWPNQLPPLHRQPLSPQKYQSCPKNPQKNTKIKTKNNCQRRPFPTKAKRKSKKYGPSKTSRISRFLT